MSVKTDNQLVEDYLTGEKESLSILIKRYVDHIFNFISGFTHDPAETEDLVQETFLKVWKNLKKFDQTKSFKPWLFTIARNSTLDRLRRKKALPFSAIEDESGDLLNQFADPEPLAHEIFDQIKLKAVVSKAIEKLPPIYQSVIILRYAEDFTFEEISQILEEPLNTVKSRYRRALNLLKKNLHQIKA